MAYGPTAIEKLDIYRAKQALTGVALVTDWQKDFGLPADTVKGGVCVSGMYDMKPVRLSGRGN